MEYRLDKTGLWDILEGWSPYATRKIRLVACGGTALTIQDLKPSTKDVDFIVPVEDEYKALITMIRRLGYELRTGTGWSRGDAYIFDLFCGNKVYVTELLESPLDEGNHIPIKDFGKISVAALNDYDLIATKMFRGTDVDVDDCTRLIRARGKTFDLERLQERYREMAGYDLQPERMMKNLQYLLDGLKEG
ncbi:MAG: DUF6036 family nucleotidyltransferase [Candidatus Brocadiia bacterium]